MNDHFSDLRRRGISVSSRIPRREFLAGAVAAGAGALLPRALSAGQEGGAVRRTWVDVHCHNSSPGFAAAIKARNTGQVALMNFSASKAIEDMDKDGVATSIWSISEPGVWFGDDEAARKLARECNELAAKQMAEYPGRFGYFATLPMPDVEGSLREIEYAFDTLKADGACFLSSYQGKYLGDPKFAPVMDELNRRRAVCYTHPCRAEWGYNLLPDARAGGVTMATDTTITITSVIFSGTAARCPNIRWIWSHGGGTLPYLAGRYANVNPNAKPDPKVPNGPLYEIQKMYYDTSNSYNAYILPTLIKVVGASHVLFGTDYPFGRAQVPAKGLTDYGFSPADLRKIQRDNAVELFPRLKGA